MARYAKRGERVSPLFLSLNHDLTNSRQDRSYDIQRVVFAVLTCKLFVARLSEKLGRSESR